VTPDRLQALKFEFRYATIDAALRNALGMQERSTASVDG
jgi:NAD dependent epimerase/dehydratase family enzyme